MSSKRIKKSFAKAISAIILLIVIGIIWYFNPDTQEKGNTENANIASANSVAVSTASFDLSSIPEYKGDAYVVLNNNKPEFEQNDFTTTSFEKYSDLDAFGRCGVAFANISLDTMPAENQERESISSVTPSGWINKKYDNVDGGYLYNRCHLIGYQLSAENANEKNLITRHKIYEYRRYVAF